MPSIAITRTKPAIPVISGTVMFLGLGVPVLLGNGVFTDVVTDSVVVGVVQLSGNDVVVLVTGSIVVRVVLRGIDVVTLVTGSVVVGVVLSGIDVWCWSLAPYWLG